MGRHEARHRERPRPWSLEQRGADNYHGLQLNLKKRCSSRFSFLKLRLVESHQESRNQIIRGWELGIIATIQSGLPFTVSEARGRPNRTCTRDAPSGGHSVQLCLDPTCFSLPAAMPNPANGGVYIPFGNAGLNVLTGPGIAKFGLTAFKAFRIDEEKRAEFRPEWFNSFNHSQLLNPLSAANTAITGEILAAWPAARCGKLSESMFRVQSKALAAAILATILVVPGHSESLDTAGKQLYAGIAVVSAGAVIGIIFLLRHEHHKSRTITGCVVSGSGGMTLKPDEGGKSYQLTGDQKDLKPGEKMRLEGRHDGNKFETQTVVKDLGACRI